MTHPSKAKGDKFERDCRDFLQEQGIPCDRIPAGSTIDRADLWVPGNTIQCKNLKTTDLAGGWRDTQLQTANNRHDFGWLVHKRHGVGDPAEQWVTCNLAQLARILEGVR